MNKITPFLWFDDRAEEAMNFYISIFKNSKVLHVSKDEQSGKVFSCSFELEGQKFNALNGGPLFKFTEAISFFVDCNTQEEVDELWNKLSEGGEKSRCGWLKDKYGLSWQIIPTILGDLLSSTEEGVSSKAMEAMMKMDKIDIEELKKAVI
jgi:predicted 3-demethylubiquinone-9 3-methyltransferase (glyoxalase superfamily)